MAKEEIKEREAPKSPNATVKEEVPVRREKPKTYQVLKSFRNAETKVMQEPEQEIEVADEKRVQKLKDKGLIRE